MLLFCFGPACLLLDSDILLRYYVGCSKFITVVSENLFKKNKTLNCLVPKCWCGNDVPSLICSILCVPHPPLLCYKNLAHTVTPLIAPSQHKLCHAFWNSGLLLLVLVTLVFVCTVANNALNAPVFLCLYFFNNL